MHPVLFKIFGFPISPYGLLIACGLLVGILLARRRARSAGIPDDAVLDAVFWGVIAGFAGARIAFIAVEWELFVRDPLALILSRTGFVFLGGLVVAVPIVVLVVRRWRVRFWAMADVMMAPLALAHALGRLGCFCAGCCFGKATSVPWGVRFPRFVEWTNGHHALDPTMIISDGGVFHADGQMLGYVSGSPAFVEQVHDGLRQWTDSCSLPVHPTQLYEAGALLALFALLTVLWRHRRFHGQLFVVYLWAYPAARFVIEFFRGDRERGLWLGERISTSQILSGLMVIAALVLTLLRRRLFVPADSPVVFPEPPAEEPPGKSPPKRR